ncbi:MAG: TolC family protein [Opitutaceae bacterium]|nr:TolC family protein [Opitutaceae bacterium]
MSPSYFLHHPHRILGLGLLLAAGVHAQEAPSFTLREALAAALLKNPALQAQAYEAHIAEARILQAGIRPNPELSVEVENILGTGALSGVKSLETTLQLSQLIELGESRARRVATTRIERGLAGTEVEVQRIEILAEVARRFTEAVADTERLTVARRAHELGEQTIAAVQARVAVGAASPVELNQARNTLAGLHLAVEHAEHELLVCHQSLAAILGENRPSFGAVHADLQTLPALPEFEDLAARLEQSPLLTRFGDEARWRESQELLARSLRRSSLRISGGLRRVAQSDDFGFVASVSLPLAVRDPAAGTVREARERRDQVAATTQTQRLELRATLFGVYQEMLHARTALAQLTREIIPTAEETLTLINQGYREGRYPLTALLEAQQTLVEFRRQMVANAAAFHLHLITIERLIGAPVQPPASQP